MTFVHETPKLFIMTAGRKSVVLLFSPVLEPQSLSPN